MSSCSTHRDRRGLTLVEMVIALTIYGVVVAGALAFVASQNTAFMRSLDRMSALRNGRYVVETLATDIPTLGTHVPAHQPTLVYADDDVLAFTADYASNVADDVFAVYVDEDAPTGQVTVPRSALTIPNSSTTWPDTLYEVAPGVASPAELLVFFLRPDSSTSRTDDYVLFRQVNDGPPEVVAKHLLQPVGGEPFFRYFRRVDHASMPSVIDTIPQASLPLAHAVPFHGAPGDTGAVALADSVRAVRVSFRSTNGASGDGERIAGVSRLIAMPNAGFGVLKSCGDEPILGSALAVANAVDAGGDPVAELTWSPATDESGGERDVVRYVLYRQTAPVGGDWGDPFISIPAGQPSYTWQDGTVVSGEEYGYALAAQDCTPSLSNLATSGTVTIP